MYKSLILPLFDYCDVVWDTAIRGELDRLQKLQNRAGRVITQSTYDIRSHDIQKSLKWENLTDRRFRHEMILMHKIMNDQTFQYLRSQLTRLSDSNHYNLRDRETELALPLPKSTESIRKSFKFRAASRYKIFRDVTSI